MKSSGVLLALLCALCGPVSSAEPAHRDIEYARAGEQSLRLDLHLPAAANPPLIVYVHGGAWRAGSKSDVPIARLLDHGFAIASVDYRLSTQAQFPAYEALNLPVQFTTIPGGKHGGAEFYDAERTGLVADFLKKHLQR